MSPQPSDGFANVNGLQMHYRDWGGRGQQVILLHGLASTSHIWDFVAPLLAEQFSVVALDQRGHGETDKPDEGYDFSTVSSDLQGFIDSQNIESPIIFGHSWGADVALEHAVRCKGVAKGIGFVDGGTIETSTRQGASLERSKVEMAPPDWTGVTIDQFKDRMRSRRPETEITTGLEDIILANFAVNDDGTIRSNLSRENHLRIIEALWDHVSSELYKHVEVPVLIMPARQNGPNADLSRRLRKDELLSLAQQRIPKNNLVWFEDSVHDVPIQRPKLVADTISNHINEGFFD